ncbi:MAG: sulfatase [candidate division Zixibacteria bacterium]|nr:sulfatase [candidate division Zixibacteria bacterium]
MSDYNKNTSLIRQLFHGFTHIIILCFTAFYLISPALKPPRKPNILLIIVDTLRYDHLGYSGYERNTSPNIDEFSKECTVFNNAYSQSGWTYPSFASIYTSLHPKDHSIIRWENQLDTSFTTLVEVLKDDGYATYGYPSHLGLDIQSGMAQGFDHYYRDVFEIEKPHARITSPIIHDLITTDLKKVKEPFFMMAHYFDPHSVYVKHPEFDFGFNAIDLYDSEIAYTDSYLGKLLAELKRLGLYDDMVIVFMADHGEEFEEHGMVLHMQLFNEVLKIPLLIKTPDSNKGIVNKNVDQIDIAPTILSLAGVEVPGQFKGRNLMNPELIRKPVFAERGSEQGRIFHRTIIDENYKMYNIILGRKFEPNPTSLYKVDTDFLFNLKTDPNEVYNILLNKENPDTLSKHLDNLFVDFYSDSISTKSSTMELDEETIEKLKGLGYIE